MLHRGDLHAALLNAVKALKPDAIALNKPCVAVIQTADLAEVRFQDDTSATAPFVIGADGIHSTVVRCCSDRVSRSSPAVSRGAG